MSGKGQRGDSYFVELYYVGGAQRGRITGRATTPERAARLAARYRGLGGEPGVVITVTSKSGHQWAPWVWNDMRKRWDREFSPHKNDARHPGEYAF